MAEVQSGIVHKCRGKQGAEARRRKICSLFRDLVDAKRGKRLLVGEMFGSAGDNVEGGREKGMGGAGVVSGEEEEKASELAVGATEVLDGAEMDEAEGAEGGETSGVGECVEISDSDEVREPEPAGGAVACPVCGAECSLEV